MEGGSLFNSGFTGSSFLWWIGQVADESVWRDNLQPNKFDDPNSGDGVPGWGYRYKVRIIGHHSEDESAVESDQLPWAQVMYPVWGGGQGSHIMTPGLRQGCFVFGFFIDGPDQQVPVIMGVLGNNAKTQLERKTSMTGGKNFSPQSAFAKSGVEEPPEQKKLQDANLATQNSNKSQESTDAVHQETASDTKKDKVLDKKHALACPDPNHKSEMKNIQTVSETLSEKITEMQKSLQTLKDAGGLPIVQATKNIDAEITKASEEMSKYMKGILGKVQQYTTDQFNETVAPLINLAPPAAKLDIMEKQVEGLEKLACAFNGMAGVALASLLAAALKSAFKRKKSRSEGVPPVGISTVAGATRTNNGVLEVFVPVIGGDGSTRGEWKSTTTTPPQLDTPGSDILPPVAPDGYYSPIPLCSTEELIGEVLGANINTIMSTFDDAVGPVVDQVRISLGEEPTESGSAPTGKVDNSINENTVLAALASGDLTNSISSEMAVQAGVDPTKIGTVAGPFAAGDYPAGLTNLIDLAGKNTPANKVLIASAVAALASGDILGGFSSVSNMLGIDSDFMNKVGGAFGAIRTGDISGLVGSMGGLASLNGGILDSIIGKGAALAGPLGNFAGGLGSLGGMNLDIGTSIGFIKSVTQLFNCDPEPECSPNDTHTMQGGGGDGGTPSESSVAKSATDGYTKPRESYGSNTLADRRSQEAKKGRTVSQAETKALIDSPKTAGKKYIPPRASYP